MNLKVGRVCLHRAGPRMQNGSGALGTDVPYHYWVQWDNARVCSGNSPPVGEGRGEGKTGQHVLRVGCKSPSAVSKQLPHSPSNSGQLPEIEMHRTGCYGNLLILE